jgi:hypothetical protein
MEEVNPRSVVENNALRLEQALKELQESCAQDRYQEFWENTINVEEMFMSLRPALAANFDRLWLRYCKLCELAQRQEAALRQQAKANATRIERELDLLSRRFVGQSTQPAATTYHRGYGAYWANAETVQQLFESLPLLEEDRERLWARYSSLCDEVSQRFGQELEESTRNRQTIESMIGEGFSRVQASSGWKELNEARGELQQARQQIRESHLLKEHLDYCWSYWREANEKLFSKQQEFQTEAYAMSKQEVDQCLEGASQGDPYLALTQVKDSSKNLNQLPLTREQREELRQLLNIAWQKATARVAEIKEERQRRQLEWLQREEQRKLKQLQWQQMMTIKLAEWEAGTKEAEEGIFRLQQAIEGLREEEGQATRVEYTRVLKNLIAQREKEIQKLRDQIAQLQSRIQEVRAKLAE